MRLHSNLYAPIQLKRKTSPPPLDADVAKRAKQAHKPSVDGGSEEFIKNCIEEKAGEAVQKRMVFKVEGVPSGAGWAELKDAVKLFTAGDKKIYIKHEAGESDAHISCHAEGNEEKFKTALAEGLKVNDTTLPLTRITDAVALKEYWVGEFTKNPPKEIEAELKKQQKASKVQPKVTLYIVCRCR